MAAARQAFAGVQRVFGGGRQPLAERRGEDATNVPRMSGGKHAGDARSSARPLVRRARGACRCGALRHAGRVAPAQPAACAGK
ncbi:hypothetical protein AQ916_01830 [Burkholderia pseudomallei]|nr:hypothetical protein AQ916_01830 [Burkholderia pseudomallei]